MKKFFVLSLSVLFLFQYSFAQNFWSSPASWPGNVKPTAGQNVTIPIGTTIILDENTPELGGLTILGTLQFAHQNLNLTASWIMVHGTLQVGSTENLYNHKATITLTGSDPNENIMGMGTRGIMIMGGNLELHAVTPSILYTKLNQHALAGSTSFSVEKTTNWNIGDEIALSPTDFYNAANGNAISQRVSITNTSANNISINQGLNSFRWGLLQYATPNGISLDSNNRVLPPKPNTDTTLTPTVLDERSVVANLTRNIVIQAPNDALWQNQGFGVHIMVMGTGAQAHLNGVEIKRGGQRNRLGRYPFHWHMLSYSGSNTLADATGHYIRNSVINSSTNRGIVIHGTNGVLVKSNIVYDIIGHGIFTEDAVERRNTIDSNVVMRIRNTSPTALPILKVHEEGPGNVFFGASGFWISNPDNTITNNIASDCQGFGFWLAFTTQPWGESINVLDTDGLLLNPSRLLFGVFDNNTASSNRNRGIMLDLVENSNAGTVIDFQYWSTTNGRQPVWPNPFARRFTLSRYKVWKNGQSGIWDRAVWPTNYEAVSADNCGRFFAGSGSDGVIERSLVVGTSLNHLMNNTNRPQLNDAIGGNETPAAFATYHSGFDIKDNIVMNFPAVNNTRSGAFATEDYYIRPVEKGPVRNVNNLLINSHVGVKLPSIFSHYSLAGALWDPMGNWNNGIVDSNKYFVYNNPFFTHGQTPISVVGGVNAGGVLVNGPFYGINDFEINRANDPQQDLMAIKVNRLNNNFDSVGTWQVAQAGDVSWILGHMRHFAAQKGAYYDLSFPTINQVSDVAFTVENMISNSDSLILAIEYSNSFLIHQVYISSFPNFMANGHANWPTSYQHKHVFQQVKDRNSLISADGVGAFWQDFQNNKVWIKIKGGIQMFWNENDFGVFSDEKLYRRFGLRVFGEPVSVWNGNQNSEWNNVLNWSNGIPSSTTNAYIPLTINQPTITSPQSVQNITINEGVVVNNQTELNITAKLVLNGSIAGQGLTLLNGSNGLQQVFNGNGTVSNLQVSNNTGAVLYNSNLTQLKIGNRLNASNAIFNTSNKLIIQPNAAITGNYNSISGNVILQQHVIGQRGWRMFAYPFTTTQTFTSLASTNGIAISTTASGASGLTDVRSFTNGTTNGWNNVTASSTTANTPFALFIRGLSSEVTGLNYTAGPSAFTFSVNGTLNASPFSITPSASNFTLVGNPFAAPVNSSALTNGTGKSYYVYQISQGGNLTAQRTKAGAWSTVLSSSATTPIPTLGVIAYQAGSATSYTVSTSDINTTNAATTGLFSTEKAIEHLELRVLQNGMQLDNLFVRQDAASSEKGTDGKDLQKLANEGLNVYTIAKADNTKLAVDARNLVGATTIPLGVVGNVGNYQLQVANLNIEGVNVSLKDAFTNTTTPLKANDNYDFAITTDAASKGENRFELVLSKAASNIAGVDVANAGKMTAKLLNGNINRNNVAQLEITGAAGKVEIRVTDMAGRLLHTQTGQNGRNTISLGRKAGVQLITISDGTTTINQKMVKQ